MGKLLTISIAAYNVEKFIKKTLDSLIVDSDELEVLIVNDGSKDETLKIAKEYEIKYPNIFRAIDKENGGYGSTINTGIIEATGKFFKQLDGDDWFDNNNLKVILEMLKNIDTDIIYTPYIQYDEKKQENKIIKDLRKKKENETLAEALKDIDALFMHSLMYKTDILKKNNIKLDEHCFYTDTQYVLFPLIKSNTIEILDIPLYVYRIGVEGQSVSRMGKLKHCKDHVKADKTIIEYIKKNKVVDVDINAFINRYMTKLLSNGIGSYLIVLKPSKENFNYICEFDQYIEKNMYEVYLQMPKYSSAVKIIRKRSYFLYRLLYMYKNKKLF